MTSSTGKVNVGWEIAKFIIPAAKEGDAEAMMLLCKLANPAWEDVQLKDFKCEALGGGFSGNVPIKCMAAGVSGCLAVKITSSDQDDDDDDNDNLVNAAYRRWSQAGIVPTVYCLGNPDAPGLEIYEFIEGSNVSWHLAKLGPEFMDNDADAAGFGTILAKLHLQPSDWYAPYTTALKGQWEDWQEGMNTNQTAVEFRAKYGDYAALTAQFGDSSSKLGKNAAAIAASCKELAPMLHELLEPRSLLGRMVIGHGDAHGGNIMYRKPNSHGDLILIDLDFAGRMPAAVDLGTALGQTAAGPIANMLNEGVHIGAYPSLKQRRLVAKAYLDTLGETAKEFTRNDIDAVVYDMEVGAAIRLLWVVPIMTHLGFNHSPKYVGYCMLFHARSYYNIFEAAKTDEALKQRVIEEGVVNIVTKGLRKAGIGEGHMTIEQYETHWNLFGSLGPSVSGPFVPDDPPPSPEDELKHAEAGGAKHYSSFEKAALRFYESTGADVAKVFKTFDTDNSGFIDMQELMACAVVCGTGFMNMADAEATFASLDTDSDGKVSFEEFKSFLALAA